MLHPSYNELMKVVNSEADSPEEAVVNSRYSIVIATAKRARQIIGGDTPLLDGVDEDSDVKPLSAAVEELATNRIQILPEDEE
ncbi:MAG: DNA-directed RNA polymerase subunit omega [Anaerostipes sp.]|uniref:DNA-directed RNA polymerase subunit omega n=1 Tax=Anaerostipes sp. 992a TaxID=1261637 RepID=UPI0009522021|nr:DNA-directed RNA polymerase subunit omega [Anaerostipes sp. 992a]MCI5952180.1 DNA-directed RNA polymerase subunit omega [Anaerostipes sp.]MDD5968515.1 DNA-directed RNA polymerase subunit omega [Anaerostipes sp.]OLR63854.1 DNA-directed RNA polymerase subunit omega [Anaerostipes sp. 992a]